MKSGQPILKKLSLNDIAMKSLFTFCTILFVFSIVSAQTNQQGIQQDPASKVLLTTDTVTPRSTKSLEKENSETVKTQNHAKITRKSKIVKKDSTSNKKRK